MRSSPASVSACSRWGAKRFVIQAQHRGERARKIVGGANGLTLNEARAAAMLAVIRGGAGPFDRPQSTLFEAVAVAVFERYAKVWKPRTLVVNRTYLRRQPLPWFAGREIAAIGQREGPALVRLASRDARRCGSLRTRPLGHREGGGASPPCLVPVGMRDRAAASSRGRAAASARGVPVQRSPAPSLVGLSRGTPPRLTDKTGPRTVWLSCAARGGLESIDRASPWVFPTRDTTRP